jgi:hypothetical protein
VRLPAVLLPVLPLDMLLLPCCGLLQRLQLHVHSIRTAQCRIYAALPFAAQAMEAHLLLLILCTAESCCTDVCCW